MSNSDLKYLFVLPVIFGLGLVVLLQMGVNLSLFLGINQLATIMPEAFWSNVTYWADGLMGVVIVAFLLRNHWGLLAWVFVGAIVCSLLIRFGKIGFDISRPPAVLDLQSFRVIGDAHTKGSFPSGHSATAFFVAAVWAAYVQHLGWAILGISLAVLGALSRVAVGVHWPADLLMGGIIGWLVGYSSVLVGWNRQSDHSAITVLLAIVLMVCAVSIALDPQYLPNILVSQMVGITVLVATVALNLNRMK